MPDDPFYRDNEDGEQWPPEPPTDPEIPASVAFMEMMRQAAAKARPQRNIWADPDIPPRRPTPPESAPEAAKPATEAPAEAPPAEPTAPSIADPSHPDYAAAMEAQRVQRIKRRNTRRRRRAVGVVGGIVRSFIIVFGAAIIMATIFTWWTPTAFISNDVRESLSVAIATSAVTMEPTGLPTPNWLRRIGIVSGHRGPENDPGAVCPDGLTEAEINFNVAQLVVRNLRGRGYTVDLLDEFDPRLDNYQAAALVSIHANTCQDFGEVVSGYLISAPAARVTARGNDDVLVGCIARHYASASGLQRREGVTIDMTDYHTFREIHAQTPAAIIELGFMLADRNLMTGQPDVLARGITDGIICFLEPGSAPTPQPTQDGL